MARNREFSPSFFAAMAIISAFLIIILGGVSAFFVTQNRLGAASSRQTQQGIQFEVRLCQTLDAIKSLTPPQPVDGHPARAYEAAEHKSLAELAADIGCPALPPKS